MRRAIQRLLPFQQVVSIASVSREYSGCYGDRLDMPCLDIDIARRVNVKIAAPVGPDVVELFDPGHATVGIELGQERIARATDGDAGPANRCRRTSQQTCEIDVVSRVKNWRLGQIVAAPAMRRRPLQLPVAVELGQQDIVEARR